MLLLLGFAIVPCTFSKTAYPLVRPSFPPLFCRRLLIQSKPWLYTNLFFSGLVNAFSAFITTLVNIYGVQGGQFSTASRATLAIRVTCKFTAVYAVLSVI